MNTWETILNFRYTGYNPQCTTAGLIVHFVGETEQDAAACALEVLGLFNEITVVLDGAQAACGLKRDLQHRVGFLGCFEEVLVFLQVRAVIKILKLKGMLDSGKGGRIPEL